MHFGSATHWDWDLRLTDLELLQLLELLELLLLERFELLLPERFELPLRPWLGGGDTRETILKPLGPFDDELFAGVCVPTPSLCAHQLTLSVKVAPPGSGPIGSWGRLLRFLGLPTVPPFPRDFTSGDLRALNP